MIKLSGLYGVFKSNIPSIDRSLITSLVETWRPETHTFYFRTGFIPHPQATVEASKSTPLNGHMLEQLQLPDLETQDTINQMTRCYMFWMIVCMMMGDTYGNYLKLTYLPMLEDINIVSSYSWGSAAVACLDALDSMTKDKVLTNVIKCVGIKCVQGQMESILNLQESEARDWILKKMDSKIGVSGS
uniref:Aminotransferase-like plant mobile domain-containing protein n=1 Tax=Solanum lycopersicum TaxID=4081 RepID=A0A3Q7FH21_SOLLC